MKIKAPSAFATKGFALEVKDISAEGVIEGYGSTFGGEPDSYGDIITRGAFAASLARHKAAGTMPLMFFGHRHDDFAIGDWTDMAEDRKGLFVRGQLDLEDPAGLRAYRSAKAKRLRGLSIGYETIKSHPDEKRRGVTHLDEIDLWEVSPVNFAANSRAGIEGVKTAFSGRLEEFARRLRDGEPLPVKEFEDILREAGVPKAMAVQIASVGYAKAIRSESEGKANEQADEGIRALREALASFQS
ncbi:HK97 family phage prohead protease [Pleomorphomonas koreensis]|uniref:HK97 family phage prohead protease n=1 Tax=Pleomorphomonas koreensis TaxID=257440 RepID=UPI000404F858|nr:HK97 family phage prohead protease [Pleomorphomonas koreensis]